MGAWIAPLVLAASLAGTALARPPAACVPDPYAGPAAWARYDDLILRHSMRRRLNPRLVKAIIAAESQFSKDAVSPAGARGLMQLMPGTAREMGAEPAALTDPEVNIRAGTRYLAQLYSAARRRGGGAGAAGRDMGRVIAAYHDGPSALRGSWPPGTRRYVRVVLSCYRSDAAVIRTTAAVAETGRTW